MKKLFTLLIALCSFLSLSFGQYSENFSTGTSTSSSYTSALPITGITSAVWTGSNLTNTGSALNVTQISNNTTLALSLKVRCGYKLDISKIAFDHSRTNDGPQTATLRIAKGGSTATIGAITPAPGTAVQNVSLPISVAEAQDIVNEVIIYLDLSNASGSPTNNVYTLDNFVLTGTLTASTASIPTSLRNICSGDNTDFTASGDITVSTSSLSLGTPSYQWQKGATDISGATSLVYSKTWAVADNGFYRLGVTYANCNAPVDPSVFSNARELNVVPLPTFGFTAQVGSKTAQSGNNTTTPIINIDFCEGEFFKFPTYSVPSNVGLLVVNAPTNSTYGGSDILPSLSPTDIIPSQVATFFGGPGLSGYGPYGVSVGFTVGSMIQGHL